MKRKIYEKRLATTRSLQIVPLINNNVASQYSFKTKILAIQKLKYFRQIFVISKENSDESFDELLFWIKGYEITEQEKSKGFFGNFCNVSIIKNDRGFTFKVEKVFRDIKIHPQKGRTSQAHPNWGHPILRKIKRGISFDSDTEAKIELTKLHEEYPNASVPGAGILYLQIFSRKYEEEIGKPIKKFIFELAQKEDEKFTIEYRENPVQGKFIRYKFHEYNFSTFE